MSAPETRATTDVATTDAATATPTPSPFTMVAGDPAAMVCEGDVCDIPGATDR